MTILIKYIFGYSRIYTHVLGVFSEMGVSIWNECPRYKLYQFMIESLFSLSKDETELLFAIEWHLVKGDIDSTPKDKEVKGRPLLEAKTAWLDEWTNLVAQRPWYGLGFAKTSGVQDVPLSKLQKSLHDLPHHKIELIAFEAAVFSPYFNLNSKRPLVPGNSIPEEERTSKFETTWMERLKGILGDSINFAEIETTVSHYKMAISEISGDRKLWTRLAILAAVGAGVTAGLLAPPIGALLGSAMGLSGAAATSAGLAFLGGGAVAAGGLGMTGGAAVLVGGGALLGGALVKAMGPNFFMHNRAVLIQLAKIDTLFYEIFDILPERDQHINEAVKSHRNTSEKLREELSAISTILESESAGELEPANVKELTDRKRRLEKSLGYFERATNRLIDCMKKPLKMVS